MVSPGSLVAPHIPGRIIGVQLRNLTKELLQEATQGLEAAPVVLPGGMTARNIRGGIKVPHLHVADKLYMLNDDQWKQLSTKIVELSQEKLAKAKKPVSFEQAAALAHAVEQLA